MMLTLNITTINKMSKQESIALRLSGEEKQAITRAAEANGLNASEFIRAEILPSIDQHFIKCQACTMPVFDRRIMPFVEGVVRVQCPHCVTEFTYSFD
jgi:hypothetical protein